jgi:Tfp pilus assembly protein PilN
MIRINLLPKAPRRRLPGRPLLEIGIPLVVALILVIWYLALSTGVERLAQQIGQVNKEIDELQPQVTAVEELKRQIEEARKKEELLAQLLATQLPASSILANLRVLIPKDVWIVSLSVPNTGSFSLDGSAMSYVAVARLMENLETARLFEGLDLTVAERERIGETDTVKYSVTGRLLRPRATPEGLR